MTLPYKILAGLILILAVFLGGYYSGKGDVEIQTVEKIVEREGKTVTVVKDHIITVTKTVEPDGTTTEVTKTEDKSTDKTKETHVTDLDKSTVTTPVLSRYSLGLFGQVRDIQVSKLQEVHPQLGISAGVRTFGDVWLKLGVIPADKSIQLGLEMHL